MRDARLVMTFLKSLGLFAASAGLFLATILHLTQEGHTTDRGTGHAIRTAADHVSSPRPLKKTPPKVASQEAPTPSFAKQDTPPQISREKQAPRHAQGSPVSQASQETPFPSIEELEAKVQEAPDDVELRIELATLYLSIKEDPDKAIPHLEHAIQLDPSQAQAFEELTSAHILRGSFEEGLDFFEGQWEAHRQDPALQAVSELLLAQGRDAEAIPVLEERLESDGPAGTALRELAFAYQASGEGQRAVETMEKWLQQHRTTIDEQKQQGQATDILEQEHDLQRLEFARVLLENDRADEARPILASLADDKIVGEEANQLLRSLSSQDDPG